MRAVEITKPGGPEVLKPATRPLPTLRDGELLIRVAATALNRADTLQRQGSYPAPEGESDILGLEVSGTVVARAKDVTSWKVGDKVCALANGGSYAEYCAVPAAHSLRIPKGLDLVEAGSLPEACFTVWHNVFERGRLRPGETLLVHRGASGIGVFAIQIARGLGARVIVTAGSPEKCAACLSLGAERAINYRAEDWVAAIKELTHGQGVDVILDMIGGDTLERNIDILAVEGRMVNIAYMTGSRADIDFAPVMRKRLTLTGSTLRPQSRDRKAEMAEALKERVWPLIDAGKVRPVIHSTFPLAKAADAHRLMESAAHIGKIVLVA